MARLIGILVGIGICVVLMVSLLSGIVSYATESESGPTAYDYVEKPRKVAFTTDGPLGRFDPQQLQRGFQVYREVCAACHGLDYVAFRSLADLGYNEPEIRAIANQWPIEVPDINPDTGEATTRPALPADLFPNPYPNDVAAAAANNNAIPPDLSLIVKARHGGAQYIHSLLTGYQDPPADLPAEFRPSEGLYYNPYFPNLNLAMPPPFSGDGQVSYADGTEATVEQMSRDVSAFLVWTAEPNLQARHRAGVAALIFLFVATGLAYMAYRNVWADRKPPKRKRAKA